jgi:NAD(P)-dependent dehydrogenase (short-subunit alcohol dehydrogenase family)
MKNIFITGASRGIGLELSKQYLELGYSVTATCRNPNGATSLRKIKDEYPLKLEILSMDVESEDSVKSCLSSLYRKNKIIDILYNNAGIIDWRDINDVEADSIEKIYQVNLTGALLVTRHAIQCLKRARDPLIINLSSRLGSIELRGETQLGGAIAYQCSKAALNMLTKQSAIDLASQRIRVISQSPGWVKTDMGGDEAKYETPESVSKMINSLNQLDNNKSGIFIGEDGQIIPW